MPLYHWPAMPRCSYDVRNNEQICSKIAEMVWYCFVCVAYQLRINGPWVTHMRRIWHMDGDATAYDENLTIAYPGRKWRIHSVHPTYAWRSTWFYGVCWAYVQRMVCVHAKPTNTPHYMWALNVTFKCPVEYICIWMSILICLIW